MGITVISSPAPASTSASAKPMAAGSTGIPEELPGGFATLLGSQLSLAAAKNLPESTAPSLPRDTQKTDEKPLGSESTDQTLALLIAVPAVAVPVQSNQPARLDTSLSRNDAGNSKDDTRQLAALTNDQRGSGETTKLSASDSAQQFSDALKTTLITPREKPGETLTANIAAETNTGSAAQASAAMASSSTAPESRAHAVATPAEVRTPLQTPSWGQDFGDKVVWMAKNDQHSAQININPPQLGPVQVTLQINGDQATAVFASPHTEVRQAIESSLSQLRDMLATAGINLGQADIGANMARQNDTPAFQSANGNRGTDENAILPDIGRTTDGAPNVPVQRGRGLVDLFA